MAEPGSWFAGDGRAAVNLFERIICGRGAVHDPATAEGMAMVSRRTAVLLPEERSAALFRPAGDFAVVYHEIGSSSHTIAARRFAHLEAKTIQEAIDHCLVAHLLVRKRRISVVCSLPLGVADRTHFVSIPSQEIIDSLLEEESETPVPTPVKERSLEQDIKEALDAVSSATGRSFVGAEASEESDGDDDQVEGKCLSLGAWPHRHFALPLMLGACARLREHRVLALDRRTDRDGGLEALVLREAKCRLAKAKDLDLVLISEPESSDLTSIQKQLRNGAVVILITAAGLDDDVLNADQRAWLAEKKARVVRIDPSSAPSFERSDEFSVLQGALLAGVAAVAPWLAEACRAAGEGDESREWGYEAVNLGLQGQSPVDGHKSEHEPPDGWAEEAARFHRSGVGARWRGEPPTSSPLWPKALAPLGRPEALCSGFPLLIRTNDDAQAEAEACSDRFEKALARLRDDGKAVPLVDEHRARFLREIRRALGDRNVASFGEVLEQAAGSFLAGFEMSDSARAELESQVRTLCDAMRSDDEVVGLSRRTLLDLHAAIVGRDRSKRLEELRKKVARLASQLREILKLDESHSAEGRTSSSLSPTLGAVTGAFLDAEALSAVLPTHRGSRHLGKQRRARMKKALSALDAYLARDRVEDAARVLYRAEAFEAVSLPRGAHRLEHARPAAAALGVFEGLAADREPLLRAMRVARLEIEGSYDPARHDDAIDSLTWSSFTEEEVLTIPQVIVLETVAGFSGAALASFSELLRSGRPIQVLVTEEAFEDLDQASADLMNGYHAGLAYLAVAHREAFVARTTPAHPMQFCESLRRASKTVRPALIVASVPTRGGVVDPAFELAAAFYARAAPVYVYDPDAGEYWAECFDLSDNPDPDRLWPRISADGDDDQEETATAVTLADVMAIDPRYRPHFRVLPPDAWSDEQIELAAFIESWAESSDRRVPFIWIEDAEGRAQRAVMTRELAFFCRDRARAWHVLQEVAGTDSEYVRRAVHQTRKAAEEETREALDAAKARHDDELEEVRMRAASEAVDRLVGVLTGSGSPPPLSDLGAWDAAPAPTSPKALDTPMSAETGEATPPTEKAAEADDDEIGGFDDPYIDSALCTTCNECTNLNGMLFKYNDNKQAEIADPSAGTFEQLVMAAEKCPVRCIHPGVPRAGDETATDEMIARAAPFN